MAAEQIQIDYFKQTYKDIKLYDKNHVATPRWLVEHIYQLINVQQFKSIWLPLTTMTPSLNYMQMN